jgi:hypothetical protein
VTLAIDPTRQRELYRVLKRTPAALAVDSRRGGLANFRAMSDRMVTFIRQIEVVFSVIIAFGVVYNSARIALAERSRELATLRVLGFTRGEVSGILVPPARGGGGGYPGRVQLLFATPVPRPWRQSADARGRNAKELRSRRRRPAVHARAGVTEPVTPALRDRSRRPST